jgi:hypothetical protein
LVALPFRVKWTTWREKERGIIVSLIMQSRL